MKQLNTNYHVPKQGKVKRIGEVKVGVVQINLYSSSSTNTGVGTYQRDNDYKSRFLANLIL